MSPYKAGRPCSHPGCPNLVRDPNRRFCDEHQAQEWKRQDARRGTAAQRGYDAEWRVTREEFLAAHPHCQRCRAPSTVPHHIVRKRDGGSDIWSNLMALCDSCHSQLHAETGDSF